MTFVSHGRKINTHQTSHFLKWAEKEVIEVLDKEDNNELLSFLNTLSDTPLTLSITLYRPWRTHAGTIRKADLSNMLKSEEDLIFNSINKWLVKNNVDLILDDSRVFKINALKVDSDEVKVAVELTKYKEEIVCPI